MLLTSTHQEFALLVSRLPMMSAVLAPPGNAVALAQKEKVNDPLPMAGRVLPRFKYAAGLAKS